jgi:carbon monoxide dehydrogenase subunit G
VSISLTPDNGYRIKSVKENDTNVTSYVSNGTYTINNISRNTNIEVEFEAIPPTTYTLSIKATGNGSVLYNGTTIRSKTSSFTVNEGASATITFSPDNEYRIKSVKVNSTDVTSSVSNNQYTISNITANTTLEVEFEAIPVTTYTLSITASGSGSASYNGTSVRSKTSTFTVNEGTKVSISLTPDNGYRIKSVKENDTNVTSYVSNGTYTINSISNTRLDVV